MKIIIIIITLLIISFSAQAQFDVPASIRVKVKDAGFCLKKNNSTGKTETTDTVMNHLLMNKSNISIRQSFPHSKNPELLKFYTIQCSANDSADVLRKLKLSKSAVNIIAEPERKTMYEPSDWYYSEKKDECWHLDKIQCPAAWDITKGSSNVTIAIIDTRFDYEHPDLKNKFILDYDPFTGIKHVQLPASSSNWDKHGTSVASGAVAQTDGGGLLASVGFNTKFYAYTLESDLEKVHQASFDFGVDVISISFYYSSSYDADAAEVIKEVIDNGTIIVAAAGNGPGQNNGGETCPYCPLNDSRIIKVSTTGRNDQHTLYNDDGTTTTDSHYPGVDICAPGEDIPVATPSGGTTWPYFGFSGETSIATPMVAATCALMRDVNKCISPEAAEIVLKESADPITDANLYPGLVGAGRLNVYQAVLGAIDEGTNHVDNLALSGTQTFIGLYIASKNTKINSGANIVMKYEKDIIFEPGFEVAVGGQLTVQQATFVCE